MIGICASDLISDLFLTSERSSLIPHGTIIKIQKYELQGPICISKELFVPILARPQHLCSSPSRRPAYWWTRERFLCNLPARIMHETPSRDRGHGRAAGQPQGLGPEVYVFSTSQGSRPEDARLPAGQNGAAPEAGGSMRQSASGASTYLRRQKGPPGFPLELSRKAWPPSPLSMPRLCAFAE